MFRVSTLNYLSWAERATSTEALAAFGGAAVTLTDHGEPERLPGSAITASMFSVLGLPPLAGRGFRAEDERPGAQRVAVIAEALWRRRFGGDAAIVGQSITLNGERHQVIGVVPRAFREVGRAQIASAGGSRRSSSRSPSIQRARIVAITSSAWSAGCVLASRWIARVTRCAASPPQWSRSSPPRTKTGACDWRRSTTPCSMSESVPRCWCCSPPWGWCCSSRVRTWRTCCWPGASLVSANWPCARRSGPDAHASFASSSRRVSASRS